MTSSAANLLAIILGIGIFLIVVAIGWRSVQNRRILRLQGADGQETVIVASEDDDISSIVTTTGSEPNPSPAAPLVVVDTEVVDPRPASSIDQGTGKTRI